ncbi:trypsin-like serine protease [candidate division WOR-3 bacterium]|uniref:Trypsin-like serine protease n=1 Tax=candidate division WOR-3 bacterium TaxID=2052148 RepID=A0A937XIE9_UNCW3|nr:trypsin-like serine protease [candidate division WOR-3 bacterium]
MRKLLPYFVIVALASALILLLWTKRVEHHRQPMLGTVIPASISDDISASRTNAIVLAARRVSPAVVSVVVTQTRVVTYDPFGGLGFDDFFRDFFPRRSFRQEVKSMGSGVIISADGDVVTNAHVVRNATRIKVTLPDNREFAAELEGIDEARDLALLKVSAQGLPAATLGNSDGLMIGEWSIAIGNPFGFMLEDAQPTVTVGVISALHRDIKSSGGTQVYADMVQTDAAINPGNSGGALVNAAGEVVGINTFIFSHSGGSEGIGFARPINDVRQFVKETRGTIGATSFERVETGLDVAVADINPVLRGNFNLGYRRGVVAVDVKAGGVGETIGMAPGDVILMAQGKAVNSAAALARLYDRLAGTIDIVIDRGGEQIRLLYRLR